MLGGVESLEQVWVEVEIVVVWKPLERRRKQHVVVEFAGCWSLVEAETMKLEMML